VITFLGCFSFYFSSPVLWTNALSRNSVRKILAALWPCHKMTLNRMGLINLFWLLWSHWFCLLISHWRLPKAQTISLTSSHAAALHLHCFMSVRGIEKTPGRLNWCWNIFFSNGEFGLISKRSKEESKRYINNLHIFNQGKLLYWS